MPEKKTVRRVAALSFAGAAIALFAAQAGSLPGLDLLQDRTSGTPAATAGAAADDEVISVSASTAHLSDRFARTQTHVVPAGSGFGAPPATETRPRAAIPLAEASPARPAAFSPSGPLEPPRAPISGGTRALSPLGLPCGLDVAADPALHATIALGIAAPCHPDAQVTIRHSGLTISARTDAVGLLALDIPAFEHPAFVSVELPDGTLGDALLPLPDLAGYDRVALVGTGPGLELHAMEGDAAWSSPGHLHPGATRSAEDASDGLGYLSTLGTEGGIVQVYTMPRTGPVAEAGVRFSVDAPVTTATCTRQAEAGLLRMEGGGRVDVTPLRFTYPGCDAVGDTLVLQNALSGLRLAAN